MLASIIVLLTIVRLSTAEDSIRVFAASSPESSSSTAGQTQVTPIDPFAFAIDSNAHVYAIELAGNLLTPRSNFTNFANIQI